MGGILSFKSSEFKYEIGATINCLTIIAIEKDKEDRKGKYYKYRCTKCGKEGLPVHRKKGQERKGGHLKKLYCIYCNEETNHAEIKENDNYTYETFREEFEAGRFVEGNRYEINELLSCTKIDCPYNKNGKCWNSDFSNDCGHRIKKELNENE